MVEYFSIFLTYTHSHFIITQSWLDIGRHLWLYMDPPYLFIVTWCRLITQWLVVLRWSIFTEGSTTPEGISNIMHYCLSINPPHEMLFNQQIELYNARHIVGMYVYIYGGNYLLVIYCYINILCWKNPVNLQYHVVK